MGSIREALVQYLALRRALGTQLLEPGVALDHFVDFLEDEEAEFITTQLALRWAQQPTHVQRATWARRLTTVRGFATWLSTSDPRTEIPPPRLLASRHRRPTPYIFTDVETVHLMTEAMRLTSSTGLRPMIYETLIGLLASTGLRPGEALALDEPDVDLDNSILSIRQTKFGKSRFVPVESSTRDALAKYAQRRNELCQSRQTNAFLVADNGKRLDGWNARSTFARISCAAGLRAAVAGKRVGTGPRLYDFRHSFTTRKLIEWYRAGVDVERELPQLATYLGHVDIGHTYWYIQAVPELLELATGFMNVRQQGGAE